MLSLVILALLQTPTANRPVGALDQIRVVTCPYADSLLGDDWEKGDVTGWRGEDGSIYVSSLSGGMVRTTIQMSAVTTYHDSFPPRDPHGILHVIVFDDPRLAQALTRADTTSLSLLLDDTLSFNLGSPVEGEVRGASRNSFLSLNLALPRSAFLALARARKGRVLIAGRTYPIGRPLLKQISRSYRAVACLPPSSFPVRAPTP